MDSGFGIGLKLLGLNPGQQFHFSYFVYFHSNASVLCSTCSTEIISNRKTSINGIPKRTIAIW